MSNRIFSSLVSMLYDSSKLIIYFEMNHRVIRANCSWHIAQITKQQSKLIENIKNIAHNVTLCKLYSAITIIFKCVTHDTRDVKYWKITAIMICLCEISCRTQKYKFVSDVFVALKTLNAELRNVSKSLWIQKYTYVG